ncbi:hypothetical protein EPUS_05211 [Endocarpon pusillum Z07020]|uniref:SCA7 domain-containing protein n=1 Tax=Endocarpon pusillum (strain Z07020 / HMAS-L-300199) TaxID=1263415 RepID=U1FZM0_ENDPU|nr:uncharacterized protein EPUS_05211 [Endocarpon pusillum Z07020]ERF70392.1 hypothetical protein EPUS_05211 [Endocarpon pusillum Z07020]
MLSASSVASSAGTVMAEASRLSKEGQKASKGKLKKPPPFPRKNSDMNVSTKSAVSSGSSSPILPEMDDDTMAAFPSGEPRKEKIDLVICKHCKRNVMRLHAKEHISGCLKSKQEKARRKKEARDAAARAKEKAEKGGDDKDDDVSDSEIKVDSKSGASGARKSTTKTSNGNNDESTKKSKKRKADGEEDKSEPKKKKNKKDEPKPKAAPKPKGPVDVEKQCGVVLPNGAQCARSLTCKSHSMGAKRAVPGRSLPYDMLLQAYQKKNQARQQKAAISANAPALYDSDPDDPSNINGAPIDSDSERDAVMTSLARNFNPAYLHSAPVYSPTNPVRGPQPLATHTIFPTRRKYQLVRMKEMLSNALSGNRGGGLFAVQDPNHGVQQQSARQTFFPGSAGGTGGGDGGGSGGGGIIGSDGFAIPSAISVPSTANSTAGDPMAEAQRRAMAATGTGGTATGTGIGMGIGQKNPSRRPTVAVAAGAD